jgi:hypothetical protein
MCMFLCLGLIAEEAGRSPIASGRRKADTAEGIMRVALAGRGIPYDERIMDAIRLINHHLDVWHKGGKIVAKVLKAAQFKETKDLKAWSGAVRNHFWYAAKACAGDVDDMRVKYHFCFLFFVIIL